MGYKIFQVSTLHALMAGYTRGVVTVQELKTRGNVGLGTFEGVDGEMTLLDGVCYRARQDGSVTKPAPDTGIPFASVAAVQGGISFDVGEMPNIGALEQELASKIDDSFALNSMHIVTVSGIFDSVSARSELGRACLRYISDPWPYCDAQDRSHRDTVADYARFRHVFPERDFAKRYCRS